MDRANICRCTMCSLGSSRGPSRDQPTARMPGAAPHLPAGGASCCEGRESAPRAPTPSSPVLDWIPHPRVCSVGLVDARRPACEASRPPSQANHSTNPPPRAVPTTTPTPTPVHHTSTPRPACAPPVARDVTTHDDVPCRLAGVVNQGGGNAEYSVHSKL